MGYDILSALFNYASLAGSWVNPVVLIFRYLFFLLDTLVYTYIPIMYFFSLLLANVDIIVGQQQILSNVAKGIYSLLAVVMLFKLAFSLLVLMTDPDKIEDKDKGTAKLFTNVIVCMILIMVVPMVFQAAGSLQDAIMGIERDQAGQISHMKTPLIEKIFYKNNAGNWCEGTKDADGNAVCPTLGVFISKAVLSSFLTLTPETVDQETNGEASAAYTKVFTSADINIFSLLGYIGNTTTFKENNSGNLPTEMDVYVYSYIPLLSTIAGGFTLWIFISLAIDIAYRSIKLFALKLIAPIPIISFVDTNSQTKGIFKKWVDEIVKTYLSLFIRLATLSIAAVILKSIDWTPKIYGDLDPSTGGTAAGLDFLNPFLKLFFILGILTFMKTAPKLFENIFGYTGKTKEESFGQNLVKGILGAGAAGAVGAVSGGISAKAHGYNPFVGAALGGYESMKAGGKAGFAGKAGDFGKAITGGPGSVAKALGYKTGIIENWKSSAIAGREKALDRKFAGLRNAANFKDLEAEDKYKSYLSGQGAAGAAELGAYNALTTKEDKEKRRKAYAESQFINKLIGMDARNAKNGNKTDFAGQYQKLKSTTMKEVYRKNVGKLEAYAEVIGKHDPELYDRISSSIKFDQERFALEADKRTKTEEYQDVHSSIQAKKFRGEDVTAEESLLASIRAEIDVIEDGLASNQVKKGKTDKALEYMVTKDPNHTEYGSIYNQIDRGGLSNTDT